MSTPAASEGEQASPWGAALRQSVPLRPRSRPSRHPRCPSPGSTQDPARRGQQGRDPCQHPGIALQMVAGGRRSLTSCPWGQRSLSLFPADFISYQVTCGIASSLATSSILRGKRISRPFLLIAEEHIRVYKGRTLCRKWQPKPGQGRAVRGVPRGARSAAAVLTRPLAAASCCPQRGEPHSSTRSSKPFRFSEKRGVTWLPCVWAPCIGMLQTCPTGPKKDLSQMVQSNLLHIPELSHIFSQCPASREAQIPLDSHGVKHLRKQH